MGLLVLVFALLPMRAKGFAKAIGEDGRFFVDLNGALRLNTGYSQTLRETRYRIQQGANMSVVRLIATGGIANKLDFELDVFGAMGTMPAAANDAITNASLTVSTYRHPWLDHSVHQGSTAGGYGLDRAFMRFNGSRASLALGRMPINYTIAGLFAVNDFFAPFSASSINTVYKPGVDAAKLAIETGNLSNIEVAAVLGHSPSADHSDEPSFQESAMLLHARTAIGPLDMSFTGGRLAAQWIAGGALQGDAGPITLYTEGHGGIRDKTIGMLPLDDQGRIDRKYMQVVTGARWMGGARNTSISMEYAYLSNGVSTHQYLYMMQRRVYADEFPHPGRQYAGIAFGTELHPLVQLGGVGMMNVVDTSGLTSVSLAVSIGDNAEWVTGALLPFGKRATVRKNAPVIRSEFGDMPFTAYTELRYYF